MRLTILGCGSSPGTPAVDRGWSECKPENPRNRRLRPSVMVEEGATRILVDTSPDLREQLLGAGVKRLDAVLYTHYHADHLHGIDDLRPINRLINAPLDVYADGETLGLIGKRFDYVFKPLAEDADFYYKPTLIGHEISGGERFTLGAIEVTAIEQDHGYCNSLGFRFGGLAYSVDVVELSDRAFALLDGIETWIIGTLGYRPHPTHAHVDKALEWIDKIKPRRAVLTHLSGALDFDSLTASLPDGVELAYDGMIIDVKTPT